MKCEVIHMVTGVTVRFFDLGGYNVTTISGLTEGQSYMVRYLQYGYADDWLESCHPVRMSEKRWSVKNGWLPVRP